MKTKGLGVVVGVMALLVGLVAVLRLTRGRDNSDPLRFAADNATTWHLKGWRTLGNAQQPWEVFYRREPLFYRERIGDGELILSDEGCVSVYLPSTKNPKGYAISTTPHLRPPSLDTFLEWATTERDPATGLPRRYLWARGNQAVAELTAEYNQPLPPVALHLALPNETLTIDMSRLAPPPNLPGWTPVASGGIAVLGKAERTEVGVVRVSLRYFVGGKAAETITALRLRHLLPSGNRRRVVDDQKADYLLLRPRARTYLPRPDDGTTNTLQAHLAANAQVARDSQQQVKMLTMRSFFNSAEEPIGEAIDKTLYLVPSTTKSNPPQTITVPIDIEVQFAQALSTRVKLGVAAIKHLEIVLPIQPINRLAPDGFPPLEVMVLEARGRALYPNRTTQDSAKALFQQALQQRLAWNPVREQQQVENTKDIQWLRDRIAGKEPQRPTGATRQ